MANYRITEGSNNRIVSDFMYNDLAYKLVLEMRKVNPECDYKVTFVPDSVQKEEKRRLEISGSTLPLKSVKEEVLEGACTSHWLKTAYSSAIDRDCLDAYYDAKILVAMLEDNLPDRIKALNQ